MMRTGSGTVLAWAGILAALLLARPAMSDELSGPGKEFLASIEGDYAFAKKGGFAISDQEGNGHFVYSAWERRDVMKICKIDAISVESGHRAVLGASNCILRKYGSVDHDLGPATPASIKLDIEVEKIANNNGVPEKVIIVNGKRAMLDIGSGD